MRRAADARDFTLLRFDPSVDVSSLVSGAAAARLPLSLLEIESDDIPDAYRHSLVLSRPDHHVAWRGNRPPADPKALIDQVRGHWRDRTGEGAAANRSCPPIRRRS